MKCVCRFVGRSLRASRLCSAGFRAGKREARCLRVPAQWAAWPTAPLCLRLVPTAKTVQSRLLFLRFFVGRAVSRWLKLSEFARLFLEGVCSFRTCITFQFVECSFLVIAGSNSTLQSHPASFFESHTNIQICESCKSCKIRVESERRLPYLNTLQGEVQLTHVFNQF